MIFDVEIIHVSPENGFGRLGNQDNTNVGFSVKNITDYAGTEFFNIAEGTWSGSGDGVAAEVLKRLLNKRELGRGDVQGI